MYSVLEEIYFGRPGISETIEISKGYKQEFEKFDILCEQINNNLSDEYKKIFIELNDGLSAVLTENSLMFFKEGFKKGLLIGIECTSN